MRHVLSGAAVALLVCASARAGEPAPHPHEPGQTTTRFTATVTSDDNGNIATINLRGRGLPAAGLDFKADVGGFAKTLKELAARHKDEATAFDIRLASKLLYAQVVTLIDECVRAGFPDVSPVPLDPPKR
jgi:hypothetical protein